MGTGGPIVEREAVWRRLFMQAICELFVLQRLVRRALFGCSNTSDAGIPTLAGLAWTRLKEESRAVKVIAASSRISGRVWPDGFRGLRGSATRILRFEMFECRVGDGSGGR